MPAASDSWTARLRSSPAGPDRTGRGTGPGRAPATPVEPSSARARHGPFSAEAIAAWLAAKVAGPMRHRSQRRSTPRGPSRASVWARSRRSSWPPSSSNGWAASSPHAGLRLSDDRRPGRYLGEELRSRRGPDSGSARPGIAAASRSRSSGSVAGSRGRAGPRHSGGCSAMASMRSAPSPTRAGTGHVAGCLGHPSPRRLPGRHRAVRRRVLRHLSPRGHLHRPPAAAAAGGGLGGARGRRAGARASRGTSVGVFVGISTNDYAQLQAMRGGASHGYRITGNAASIAANRISYHFDFQGPSLAVDTACSSSLVAVHLACRSLRDGESSWRSRAAST